MHSLRLFLPTLFVLFGAIGAAKSADSINALLHLVPPDTTICLVLRDGSQHLKTIGESPMAEWFLKSTVGKQLADANELDKLKVAEQFLTTQLGVTSEQVRDAVLGDAIVLAYQPGPVGKPDSETGIIFIKPRSMDVLQQLIDGVNKLQLQGNEIRPVKELSHRGQRYFVREKVAGGREFYRVHDGIFAFSSREQAIHGVIDQSLIPLTDKPSGIAARLLELGVSKKMAVCLFNPRGFDAELVTKTEGSKDGNEKAFLTQFRKVWTATNSFAISIHPTHELEIGVVANFDRELLPKELQPILFPTAGVSKLWSMVPTEAMVALGGRVNANHVRDALATFLPDGGKEGLAHALDQGVGPAVGRDKLGLVLNSLGPDWIFWVEPPAKSNWAPAWTFALQLTSGDKPADLNRAVLQGLDFLGQFVRFTYNRTHTDQIDATETVKNDLVVKSLANPVAFPSGFTPSYTVKDHHLLIASSEDRIRNFTPPTATKTDAPLIRIAAQNIQAYLKQHKPDVAKVLATASNRPQKDVDRELGDIVALLELFDRVELKQSRTKNRVELTLQFQFIKPLAK